MDEHALWFQQFRESDDFRKLQARPIAYFCAEFALDPIVRDPGLGLQDDLKLYAGGLGVLAGDVVREAADQHFPLVGVGLMYQSIEDLTFLTPVIDHFRQPVKVRIPLQDRHILVRAYQWSQRGAASGYLLTSDVDGNQPRDRAICNQIYPADKEKRLQQEMILGIGGLRLLEAIGIHPGVYHLNEGHSALLAVEIIQHEIRERLIRFEDAVDLARRRIVFTNHTLLAGGNDIFNNDLVAANLSGLAEELVIPVDKLVKLGLVQESSLFSMTMLSLRMAHKTNAVSRLHAGLAAEIWTDHPMEGITNGIHLKTWDKLSLPSQQMWPAHQQNKLQFLDYIQKITGRQWDENHLLIGWARRITGYKRPLAILADVNRLAQICRRQDRPVRLVFAGNPHPADDEGRRLALELQKIIHEKLGDVACFWPDYNQQLAGLMTAGCDAWLNTPAVGFEACGTSGMKAMLNGVLPISTKDGWMAEIDTYGVGWTLDDADVGHSFYRLLETEIAPMYYSRNQDGVAEKWLQNMQRARGLILENYSTTRMLKEYIEKLYLPILA